MERWKAKAMAIKQSKDRGGISLSSEEKDESTINNNIDLDQPTDKYLSQL